jgi:FHA domain
MPADLLPTDPLTWAGSSQPDQEKSFSLLVVQDSETYSYPLPTSGRLLIGRAPHADVRVDHGSVSREHAALHLGEILEIEDLGSANGSRLREALLRPGVRACRGVSGRRDRSRHRAARNSISPDRAALAAFLRPRVLRAARRRRVRSSGQRRRAARGRRDLRRGRLGHARGAVAARLTASGAGSDREPCAWKVRNPLARYCPRRRRGARRTHAGATEATFIARSRNRALLPARRWQRRRVARAGARRLARARRASPADGFSRPRRDHAARVQALGSRRRERSSRNAVGGDGRRQGAVRGARAQSVAARSTTVLAPELRGVVGGVDRERALRLRARSFRRGGHGQAGAPRVCLWWQPVSRRNRRPTAQHSGHCCAYAKRKRCCGWVRALREPSIFG